jgi:hypothetical protein
MSQVKSLGGKNRLCSLEYISLQTEMYIRLAGKVGWTCLSMLSCVLARVHCLGAMPQAADSCKSFSALLCFWLKLSRHLAISSGRGRPVLLSL